LSRPALSPEPAIWPANVQPIFLADWAEKDPPPREWLVEGLVSVGSVTSLYGHGGSGKSMLALDLMVETAAAIQHVNRTWLGRSVRFGMALGLFAEDDEAECVRRLKRICSAKGLHIGDHAASLQVVSLMGEDATLVEFDIDGRDSLTTPLFRRLEELVAEHFPQLLVLDYAAAMFGGNEMSRAQVGAFMRVLNGFAARHRLAILLLGHPSAEGLKNGRGFSGSTAWHNNARCFLHLETEDEEPDDDGRSRAKVTVRKNNYGRSGDVFKLAFDGSAFELIEETRGGPPATRRKLTARQELVLRAVGLCVDAGQCELVPSVPGVPSRTLGVRREALKKRVIEIGYSDRDEKPDTIKRNINRDLQALIAAQKLRGQGEVVWLV
jgi:hypothetical protein